jgi:perosamine synthetase
MIQLSVPTITEKMKNKVLDVLNSGRFIKGNNVAAFEEIFSRYCGVKYGVSVSSGTAAIFLALKALGVGEGDEIIVPSHTFIASATPILMVGAKPVFVDIGDDFLMDMSDVENKVTSRTKAVVCVHLYGQICDMTRLAQLKEKFGFSIVEDCCQAHGAVYKGKKAGSFGDIACFSFFPSKNMTVAGDGGMAVTSDENLYNTMKMLRDHGRDYSTKEGKYISTVLGYNFRMSEISAALGLCQLELLDEWSERRREIASLYNEVVTDEVIKPMVGKNRKHVYHLYVIRTKKREELGNFLHKNGIETGIHYPIPVHKQPIFEACHLPVTEKICEEILSIPIYPLLNDEQVIQVCNKINEFFE